jgi:hypothetical protein
MKTLRPDLVSASTVSKPFHTASYLSSDVVKTKENDGEERNDIDDAIRTTAESRSVHVNC